MALLALAVTGGNDAQLDTTPGPSRSVLVQLPTMRGNLADVAGYWPGGLDAHFTSTPIPEPADPSPEPESNMPSLLPPRSQEGAIEAAFFAGWHDAGGSSLKEDTALWRMIQCESGWRINPPGEHLGLAQFEEGSWWTVAGITGYTDWADPFSSGFNAATWAGMIDPGTTAGWPNCWGR